MNTRKKASWFQAFLDAIKKILGGVTPAPVDPNLAALPETKRVECLYTDGTTWRKASSIQKASCGLLLCTYHNITRSDSWIGLINNGYKVLISTQNETIGTPALVDGWWTFAFESGKKEQLIKVNDVTGEVSRGIKALDEYATMCVDGYIAYSSPVRLVDPAGKVVHTWTNFSGFVAGLARMGDEWLVASMDGNNVGIASTKGWKLNGEYPEVAVLNGKILGFAKNGEVHEIANGKVVKVLFKTGSKANRARVKDGLVYWTTADYDQLWVTNGRDFKRLAEWTEGDKPNGTTSGSGFNTSLTFDGNDVVVARSVTNRGVEVWRVILK